MEWISVMTNSWHDNEYRCLGRDRGGRVWDTVGYKNHPPGHLKTHLKRRPRTTVLYDNDDPEWRHFELTHLNYPEPGPRQNRCHNTLCFSGNLSSRGSHASSFGTDLSGSNGLLHVASMDFGTAPEPPGGKPKTNGGYRQNRSEANESQSKNGGGIVRRSLPEGFWRATAWVFVIVGSAVGLIMWGMARWDDDRRKVVSQRPNQKREKC
jgi:hypothetical protein